MNASLKRPHLPFAAAGIALLAVASAPAATIQIHGVGDLPGGIVTSHVRDATKVGGVLFAVGGSSANAGSTQADTGFLWSPVSGLQALPDLVPNDVGGTFVAASAITPDGRYIAARAHSTALGGARLAVRVTREGLVNFNLGAINGQTGNNAATAISDDGSVLFGITQGLSQAVRYTVTPPTATLIPFLRAGDVASFPAARGTSADGSVMVGSSAASPRQTDGQAFRYVQGAGVSAIPLLPGGTWSTALGVTPNGRWSLVVGDSARHPVGEAYVHDAQTGALTGLGSANEAWRPTNVGAMTADASVIALTFNSITTNTLPPGEGSFACFRNSHGWFHLASAVRDGGLDPTAAGWMFTSIFGISRDGTLVFGGGLHNGDPEGFIVEFPPGYLASYHPLPESPVNPAIVGTWLIGNPPNQGFVILFLEDGTYVSLRKSSAIQVAEGGSDGLERGLYSWNPATGDLSFITRQDTDGGDGPSGLNGASGVTIQVAGDTALVHIPGQGDESAARLKGGLGTLAGGWVFDADPGSGNVTVAVFLPDGTFYQGQAGDPAAEGSVVARRNGIEEGTYSWNPVTGAFAVQVAIDTNGNDGLSGLSPAARVVLSDGQTSLQLLDDASTSTAFAVTEVRLRVTPVADGVELAWPAHLTRYAVESSANLGNPLWKTVAGTPVSSNGLLRLSVPRGAGGDYFRLAYQWPPD